MERLNQKEASGKVFDTKRDRVTMNAGDFFCYACLEDKLADENSPDPRYCQGCFDFLLKEAKVLGSGRRPQWVPGVLQKPVAEPVQPAPGVGHNNTGTLIGSGIMSTLKGKKIEVDIIAPAEATKSCGKRGPKQKPLPDDLIEQLVGEGMGSKAIATKLKGKFGIEVSYKTIQRRLSAMKKP